MNSKGQIAVYVLSAIIILALIGLFYVFLEEGESEQKSGYSGEIFEIYSSCIETELRSALSIAGSQGGYIDAVEYIPPSDFAPSSNQLNFLGIPIPYWYYISSNGVAKKQVPSLDKIEKEIEQYLSDKLNDCDFGNLNNQSGEISLKEPVVSVRIDKNRVEAEINNEIVVTINNESVRKSKHLASVDSNFGNLYNEAIKIYDEELEKSIFENYALDVLYNYAPVDGVEAECAPMVWRTKNISEDIKNALETNIGSIKFAKSKTDFDENLSYFVVEKELSSNVNLIYSRDWPTKIEIDGEGVSQETIIAKPMGMQAGLGTMGFCYIPYHYIYDLSFPVLIQLYEGEDIFQFPVVSVIENNNPRASVKSNSTIDFERDGFDLCQYPDKKIEVYVFDNQLEPVNGIVSFECFNQRCDLGKTKGGRIMADVPACMNGYLTVSAEGYAEKKKAISTNQESFSEIFLEREYETEIEFYLDGRNMSGNKTAVVSFNGLNGSFSTSAVVPGNSRLRLSEGLYDVRVYIYEPGNIKIGASEKRECTSAPREGIAGVFGMTKEYCYDIEIPESTLSNVIVGGGKTQVYLIQSDLEDRKIKIDSMSFPRANSLEELQTNLAALEVNNVEVYP